LGRSDAGRRRKIHILLLYYHGSFVCFFPGAQITLLDDSQIQKCIKDLGPLIQDLSQDDTAAGLMNYAKKLKATMQVFCYSRGDLLRSHNSHFLHYLGGVGDAGSSVQSRDDAARPLRASRS
jgi:hypothetical protein